MRKIFLTMLGVVVLACVSPAVGQADPMLSIAMELQGTVDNVNLDTNTVVISGTTFRLAQNVVVHTAGQEQRTALKVGDVVGYQLDKNNAKLIRQIMIMPHR